MKEYLYFTYIKEPEPQVPSINNKNIMARMKTACTNKISSLFSSRKSKYEKPSLKDTGLLEEEQE